MKDRAWIQINAEHLKQNVEILKKHLCDGCEIMAVIKADAYGHGAVVTAKLLEGFGVCAFAVATLDEGIMLRKNGIRSDILILGYTAPYRAKELFYYKLTATLVDFEHATELAKQGYLVDAHMKIDTGMHRLGFDDKKMDQIVECFYLPNVKISGIYSHLCTSDSLADLDVAFTLSQIERFDHVLNQLRMRGIVVKKTHLQSSYGLLNYPELRYRYVRVGIALYGVYSEVADKTKLQLQLQPVLSLKSRIVHIAELEQGESIGYGRSFTAKVNMRIAVVSIGYADGLPRSLSDRGAVVWVNGKTAPIVGRICMDQLMIDVTQISDVKTADEVTIIGDDGGNTLLAADIAHMSGTITNELLSNMGKRLPVIVC